MTRSIFVGFQIKADHEVEVKPKRAPLLPRKAVKINDYKAYAEDTAKKFPVITEYLGN